MGDVNYILILTAALVAVMSPGPATMAIAESSMSRGRQFGSIMALGITTGSMFWSISAALGMSALMMAKPWVFEWVRYLGVSYLLYLAFMSARSVCCSQVSNQLVRTRSLGGFRAAYLKGLGIHLTNPKAILFFGSLYALGIPAETSIKQIAILNGLIIFQGFCVFQLYAFLFSMQKVRQGYTKLNRLFESLFAVFFGAAGVSLLMVDLD